MRTRTAIALIVLALLCSCTSTQRYTYAYDDELTLQQLIHWIANIYELDFHVNGNRVIFWPESTAVIAKFPLRSDVEPERIKETEKLLINAAQHETTNLEITVEDSNYVIFQGQWQKVRWALNAYKNFRVTDWKNSEYWIQNHQFLDDVRVSGFYLENAGVIKSLIALEELANQNSETQWDLILIKPTIIVVGDVRLEPNDSILKFCNE